VHAVRPAKDVFFEIIEEWIEATQGMAATVAPD
jgi:hypothetical protein